ncbi:MAG: molecular chaperone HtpG [Spirochaetes bacterium]|nr:MAG: molecular chaperone HtpG [Spirochaetota bacterium]
MSKHQFQTEVAQLLHLIIHSLYSHKEIFLRELISNASDALDKLKYLTYTDDAYRGISFDPRVDISFDTVANTLTIADSGIGMNEQDLMENLGTIARSGTRGFVEQLSGDARKDANLIGQFGVGFYSSFMVADRVIVVCRKAGEEKAWRWTSEGRGEYEIAEDTRDSQGTTVTLHLNEEGKEFTNKYSIERIIKKYSNHIPFSIYLHYEDSRWEGEGKDRKEIREPRIDRINDGTALWKKPKNELKDEDYNEFYKVISHDADDPLLYVHTVAEGTMDYTTLFFVPKKAPMDLYFADFKPGVKLYVKRVFITDDDKELIPVYLRFVRGIIDSEDLPLNVSREILQQNRVLAKIRSTSVKKILGEFQKLAENEEKYAEFYAQFGRPLKEGLYADHENRETLMDLVRFKSTAVDGYTSLAAYKGRMKPDQNNIYYITGERESNLRQSPLIEMYRDKGIEVLIADDELDDLVISYVHSYKDTELKSVNRSDAAEDLKSESDLKEEKSAEPLIQKMKDILKDRVKDVKASTRLTGSPSCIVVDQSDPTVQMQGILKAMGHMEGGQVKPILEINPNHAIIKGLEGMSDDERIRDVSFLLLEQAMLIEGVKLENPAEFVQRLNRVMEHAV